MTSPTSRRPWILFVILGLIGFLEAWLWWVPVRCLLDGNGFQWANSFGFAVLRGPGMLGHFPILVLLSCFVVSLMYLGWRGSRMPFHVMLIVLCLVELSGALVHAWNSPQSYRFVGDTFGIDVSLVFWGPALWIALLTITGWWIWSTRDSAAEATVPAWTRTNTVLLVLALGLLPIQFVLFRAGEQHGLTDKIALIMTISQWVLLNVSFMPFRARATPADSAIVPV